MNFIRLEVIVIYFNCRKSLLLQIRVIVDTVYCCFIGYNNNNDNNNNNNNKLQLIYHPVAVFNLHVYKHEIGLLLNLCREGYIRSM
jgi:hypothetical protein